MSTTDAGVVGLVKVTVRHADKSADLALPAAVPVAELIPEVART
ncbi:EsaB/YukD family protein, partial [Xanthomonas perforans]